MSSSSDLEPAPVLATRRPRRNTGRVTLADVARLAEVSSQTVSRALNNPDSVPPATLDRVQRAVKEAGYVPDLLAGGLASGRTRLVAALVPTIAGPVFMETLQALQQTLMRRGYQLMLGESGYDDAEEHQLLANLVSRRPDGIVLTRLVQSAPARELLRTTGIPVVETWDLSDEPVDMLIGFSHYQVGEAVARFLQEIGRRRPALVTGDDPRAGMRQRAFARELAVLGLVESEQALPVAVAPAPMTVGAGRALVSQLLASHADIDAIFCSSDAAAWGAITELRERGIQVPGDVAVIGFGDMGFARDLAPALTTVRIDGPRIGRQAAEWILQRSDGKTVDAQSVDIGFSLVRRASA